MLDNNLKKFAELLERKDAIIKANEFVFKNLADVEKQIKVVENLIKTDEERQFKRVSGNYIFTKKVQLANRFNTAKFKKENTKLYNDYLKTSESIRFKIERTN